MKKQPLLLSTLTLALMLSACATTQNKKSVIVYGENQMVELEGEKSCRIVKSGPSNFRCVPVRDIASRPKAR